MYTALGYFLFSLQQPNLTWIEYTGRILSMGLLCGVFGINVAHKLGHRTNKFEQALAKSLLLTSQYLHFFIEHNRGHHKRVATPNDPSSARLNEWLFSFMCEPLFIVISVHGILPMLICRRKDILFSACTTSWCCLHSSS